MAANQYVVDLNTLRCNLDPAVIPRVQYIRPMYSNVTVSGDFTLTYTIQKVEDSFVHACLYLGRYISLTNLSEFSNAAVVVDASAAGLLRPWCPLEKYEMQE